MLSIVLALSLSSFAHADSGAAPATAQTTKLSDQQIATMLLGLQADRAQAAADLAKAERLLAAAKKAAASPSRIAPPTDIAPLQAEVAALKAKVDGYDAVIAGINEAIAKKADKTDFDALVARVAELEAHPRVVNTTVVQPEIHTVETVRVENTVTVQGNNFHPQAFANADLLIVDPLPGQTDQFVGRANFGVNLLWEVPKFEDKWVAGLSVEAGPSVGGWSVRGGPTAVYVGDGAFNGFGALVAVGYNCDRLDGLCGAEHTGVMVAGTWQRKLIGPLNVNARLGFEGNHVTATAATPGNEFRPVLGAGISFGELKPTTVTSSQQ